MAGGGDARRSVHVWADVALLSEKRRPGVQADPHADRPGCERLPELSRRAQGAGRGREGCEEGVTLRVDLGSTRVLECLSDDAPVLG